MKTFWIIIMIFIFLSIRKRRQQGGTKQPQDSAPPSAPGPGPGTPAPPPHERAPFPEQQPIYNVCRRCGSLVTRQDFRCPACGKIQRPALVWILLLLLALGFALFLLVEKS